MSLPLIFKLIMRIDLNYEFNIWKFVYNQM